MEHTTKMHMKYGFGIILVLLGVIFGLLNIGKNQFFGFSSVPSYLIYIGIISILVMLVSTFVNKKRIVDERMLNIADKATRIVYLCIILVSFAVMIVDGISPITIPYHVFMSYFICVIMLIYVFSYKILLKYY
jgi:hypothetical protein